MENGNISDSGGIDDQREEIQSLSSIDEAQWYINDENSVIIRDGFYNDSGVFPPRNHEGLQVAAPPEKELNEAPQGLHSSCSSASLSSDGGANAKSEAEPIKNKTGSWMRMGLGLLGSRIIEVSSHLRKYAVFRASVLLFASVTTGMGALLFVILLFTREHKWRRQMRAENKQHLILLIKEKDQKINQLLLQIAQLNEILLARRRVPVLQVG